MGVSPRVTDTPPLLITEVSLSPESVIAAPGEQPLFCLIRVSALFLWEGHGALGDTLARDKGKVPVRIYEVVKVHEGSR